MTSSTTTTTVPPRQAQCGCCGRHLPANRVTELGTTPGVFICSTCALWAAGRASRLPKPDIRRVVAAGTALIGRRRHRHVHASIPILTSRDLDRTITFWGTIGFQVVQRHDGYLVLHADGVELHFSESGAEDEPRPRGQGPAVAFILVEDAMQLWKRLLEVDLAGLGPVEDQDYGLREFVVIDPDGNMVRIGNPL